jgi:hypothetical protein
MGTCLSDGLVIDKRYNRVTISWPAALPLPQARALPCSNILAYLRRPEPTLVFAEFMRSSSRLAGIVPRLSPDNSTMSAKA